VPADNADGVSNIGCQPQPPVDIGRLTAGDEPWLGLAGVRV
jgi:hypothetical protein